LALPELYNAYRSNELLEPPMMVVVVVVSRQWSLCHTEKSMWFNQVREVAADSLLNLADFVLVLQERLLLVDECSYRPNLRNGLDQVVSIDVLFWRMFDNVLVARYQ
jgi:hypothetical protein